MYADRIEVISPGSLPKGLTLADLGRMSIRRNPLIADLLHRIGFIEKAGTGIRRIRDGARAQDCPEPEFGVDRFVTVTFRPNPEVREMSGDGQVLPEVAPQLTGEATPQIRLIRAVLGEMAGQQLQEALNLSDTKYFRSNFLLPALHDDLIEMTVPDKPRSSKQRYRLTPKGSEHLKQMLVGNKFRSQEATPQVTPKVTPKVTPQVTPKVTPQLTGEATPQIRLIRAVLGEMAGQQLQEALNLNDTKYFRSNFLLPALHDGLIEMTVPDKPRSSKQRYRLTPKGSEHLKQMLVGNKFRSQEATPQVTPKVTPQVTPKVTPQVTPKVAPQVAPQLTGEATPQIRLIRAVLGEMAGQQLQEALNLSDTKYFRSNFLLPALHDGLIEMTVPDKPRSSKQRYRLTPKGSEHLKRIGEAR